MRRGILLCLAALALAAAGCGSSDEPSTPVACLSGSGTYLSALREAPGQVRLEDSTPISECLVDGQQAGDLGTVGEAMVSAATELNDRARRDPNGAAAVELGYLVGAAERGAEQTAGIHTDLVRRLATAARFSQRDAPPAPAFDRAYERGRSAGATSG